MDSKPENLKSNDFNDRLYESIKGQTGRKTFKAVHFSDAHVDLMYTPGTNANCNMPLCCRVENGYPSNPEDAAGYWGNYNCDTTHAVMTEMFKYINNTI